jgi:hypothetical protein
LVTAPFNPVRFAGQLPTDLPSVTMDSGALYLDGIPTTVRGNHVARVSIVAGLPIGTTLLVAGWYRPLDCNSVLDGFWCWPGALFDLPAGSSRTDAMALDTSLGKVSGPRIVRATVSPNTNCILDGGSYCPLTLAVKSVVWSGDRATLSVPIGPVELLSELTARFPYVDFMPLSVGSDCRASLPAQVYGTAPIVGMGPESGLPLPVSLVLLFRSSSARRAFDPGVLVACPEISGGLVDLHDASWISRRNVTLLSTGPSAAAAVKDGLAAALKAGN